MFKLISFLNCIFILVTSNPLQGFQSGPHAYQQNYANINPSQTRTNFDGYAQQLQSQPLYQTTNPYEEQVKRLYLDKILAKPATISYVDPNNNIYRPNGIDISRLVSNPTRNLQNTASSYIMVPQEYLQNLTYGNKLIHYIPQTSNRNINSNVWIPNYSYIPYENYNANSQKTVTNIENNNQNKKKFKSSDKLKAKKGQNQREKASRKNESKSPRNNERKKNKSKISKTSNKKGYSDEECSQGSKSKTSKPNVENSRENYSNQIKRTSQRKEIKKDTNKKLKSNVKLKSTKKSSLDEGSAELKIDTKVKETLSKTGGSECFDMSEDCTDLENRRTRNNYNNGDAIPNFQHQFPALPEDFNDNIGSYLNSFKPNQNLYSNLFSGNGNIPYNLDYLFQPPQFTNVQNTGGSNKKRSSRKKKKKEKSKSKTEIEQNSSNQQKEKKMCTIKVELLPKVIDIKTTTEPIPIVVPSTENVMPETLNIEQKISDDTKVQLVDPPKSNISHHPIIDDPLEYTSNELSQEYVMPFVYDNGVTNEYYPDFTSDKIYSSTEDNEWNFHGRHYYTSDNKPEGNRERRKYEPNHRKQILEEIDEDNKRINKENEIIVNSSKKSETSAEEIKFKTPPILEFPDFKTEMVNKDRYSSRAEPYYPYDNKDQSDKISTYSNAKPTDRLGKTNDNTVETIYAHSKVVRYGAADQDDKVRSMPFEYIKNNVYTSDEETVVVAESLNYPENYY